MQDLADRASIGTTTLKRLEAGEGVPNIQLRTLEALKRALEAAGIEFIGTPESGSGVRWKP